MAFNPPLGSTNADVFMGNVQRLDELVNGPAADVPDRAGDPLYSWRQMMAKNEETRQNLIPLSRQYMTLADAQADIANIPEGSTTYYRSPDDNALAIEVTVFCKNGDITNPELSGGKMPDAGRNMTWDLRAPAPTPSHLRATVAIKGSFRGAEF